MIKAVFMDYTGTTVYESEKEMNEIAMRICKNSKFTDTQDVLKTWKETMEQYDNKSYKESYLNGDEIVERTLQDFTRLFQLEENLSELQSLVQEAWRNVSVFDDVPPFYEAISVPIYIVSNNRIQYIENAIKKNNLTPAGIVCADMVRAYKPRAELFEKALEISGCRPEEVLHIGDSFHADVQGASQVGIKPVLIQRNSNCTYENTTIVKNLLEVLPLLKTTN